MVANPPCIPHSFRVGRFRIRRPFLRTLIPNTRITQGDQ